MMEYYTNCKVSVAIAPDSAISESTVREALRKDMPGIDVDFRIDPAAEHPTLLEVFLPDSHPLAGAREQTFNSTEWMPTGPRTLLMMAQEALTKLQP